MPSKTYANQEYKNSSVQTKKALQEFSDAVAEFSKQSAIAVYDIPSNVVGGAGVVFARIGDVNQLLWELIFKPMPEDNFFSRKPSEKDIPKRAPLTRMPCGILPMMVFSMKKDADLASWFEGWARVLLLQQEHEVEDKASPGEKKIMVDVFGYGKIGAKAKAFAKQMKRDKPGFMNNCWNSMINVVEKLGVFCDSLAKLMYIPFVTWKATAEAKNAVIEIVNDCIEPVGHFLEGMANICHGVGDNMAKISHKISWKGTWESSTKEVDQMSQELDDSGVYPEASAGV